MPFIEVGEHDIHYVEAGSGQPVVCLHGFGSCAQAWYQQAAALSDRYRVIAYDSVNHGHSTNSPRDEPEPDRADELEGVLLALGIERPILMGNSMGAMTTLRWAVRHPEAALALVPSGMGVTLGDEGEATRRAIEAPIEPDVLFMASERAFTAAFREGSPRRYERYVRLRSTATRLEASRHPRQATLVGPSRAEVADAVHAIRSPMQIVVGELDWLLEPARRLHERVDGSRLAVLPGAPHNAYFEMPDAWLAVVDPFLEEVAAG